MSKMVTGSTVAVKQQHVLKAANFALERGLPIVALCGADCDFQKHTKRGHAPSYSGKVPLTAGWADNPIHRVEDLPAETGNVGILCGNGLAMLDLDCAEAIAWSDATQPVTPWRTRTSAPDREHRYYRDNGGGGMVLRIGAKTAHLRTERLLAVAPYSKHSNGATYLPIGDWSQPMSALPHFDRAVAELVRGAKQDGKEKIGDCKARAIETGELPPSGKWSDSEVQALIDDARRRMAPNQGNKSFRTARYRAYLNSLPPCIAGAAHAEALNVIRVGLIYLLLPMSAVLDLAAASRWAVEATDANGTSWPWLREQLGDVALTAARSSWRSSFGKWVSRPALHTAALAGSAVAP